MDLPLRFQLAVAGLGLDIFASESLDLRTFEARADKFRRAPSSRDLWVEIRSRSAAEMPVPFSEPVIRATSAGAVLEGGGARLHFGEEEDHVVASIELGFGGIAFENVLRLLVSRSLLQRDGALLHAAALMRDGLGVVFPGVSGIGKSTLALRHPEQERISEDLVAVRRTDHGWIIESLPFFAVNRLDVGPRSAPLSCFAFLRQGAGAHAQPLSRREVRRALARSLVVYAAFGVEQTALTRILDLSEEVPAFDLEVDREAEVWPELQRHLRARRS